MLHPTYLKRKFTYSPETGELRRVRKKGTPPPAGNEVGNVWLAGGVYHVADIAFAMGTGQWPERPVRTKDGTLDLRLSNLEFIPEGEDHHRPSIKSAQNFPDPEEFIYYP